MNTDTILTILGLYMVVCGLAMLLRRRQFATVIEDLFAHPALMWVAGLALMFLGGALALGKGASTWVMVLGWLILLKGVSYILVPDLYPRFLASPRPGAMLFSGVVVLAIGILLLVVL